MNAEHQTLIRFPCDFPLKVIGRLENDFANDIVAIILRHAPNFDSAAITMRPSRNANYISLTCTIHAESKQQLDNLYQDLSVHPRVLMAL